MTPYIALQLSSSLDNWLCAALIAFALSVPFAIIAVDSLLAKQPEWMPSTGMIAKSCWPRVVTAAGTTLLIAAFLTLMVLCAQLAAG